MSTSVIKLCIFIVMTIKINLTNRPILKNIVRMKNKTMKNIKKKKDQKETIIMKIMNLIIIIKIIKIIVMIKKFQNLYKVKIMIINKKIPKIKIIQIILLKPMFQINKILLQNKQLHQIINQLALLEMYNKRNLKQQKANSNH